MNYQNVLCIGDSLTTGARTYGCYPVHLARILTKRTPYAWCTVTRATNGHTARDVWFRVNSELDTLTDVFQACVLVGTNDVGTGAPIDLFCEYYRQILRALYIKGYKAIFCGEIPPIFPDGHVFFPQECARRRDEFNVAIQEVVTDTAGARLVRFPSLTRDQYEDPVHLNEAGNIIVADAFATAVESQ